MSAVCDIPVVSMVCDAVGETAATIITAPFDLIANGMAGAAAWVIESLWAVFDTTTLVDVTSPEYVGVYNVLFGIAIFVALIFFCLQLITGLLHRDPTALSRAALGLGKSILGSFIVITLTALLLEVTDQLAVGIVQATGNTMEGLGNQIILLTAGLTGLSATAPGVGAIITIFLAGLALSAAAIVWFSLLIRKALLLVAIALGPIALAGMTWDATKGWFGKWATFVVALIFSKLVLVVIFLVAIGQVSSPIELDITALTDPIAGIVLLFIGAFAPYITYKFLSFVGFDMYHAMSSEQEAKASLNRPVPIPAAPSADSAKKVLDGGRQPTGTGSGAGGGTPPASSPTDAPAGGPAAGDASAAGAGSSTAAGGGTAASSAGAGGGASAGAGAAGAGAAAGPVGAALVAGAAVVKGAATAGPKTGAAVGGAAEGHAGAATEQASPPPAPPSQASPPARPAPTSTAPATAPPATSSGSAPRRSDPPPAPSTKPGRSGKE